MAEIKEVGIDIRAGVRFNTSEVKVSCQEVTDAVIQRIDMSSKACIEAARDQNLAPLLGTMTQKLVTLEEALFKTRRQAEEALNAHVQVMELIEGLERSMTANSINMNGYWEKSINQMVQKVTNMTHDALEKNDDHMEEMTEYIAILASHVNAHPPVPAGRPEAIGESEKRKDQFCCDQAA